MQAIGAAAVALACLGVTALAGCRTAAQSTAVATLSEDGRRLFTGLEAPLVQDGDGEGVVDRGARTRLLEYTLQGDIFVPGREWVYELDAAMRPAFSSNLYINGYINGLVELAATGGERLLALERSYAEEAAGRGGSGSYYT